MIAISISPSTISSAGVFARASKLSEILNALPVLAPPELFIHVRQAHAKRGHCTGETGQSETLKGTTLVCVCALADTEFRGEPVSAEIKK